VGRPLLGLAVILLVFGGGLGAGLLSRSASTTRTVTETTVEVVNGSRTAGANPAPIPTMLEGVEPRAIQLSLAIPSDAELVSADSVIGAPPQLAVTWERAHLTADGSAAIWQRFGVALWQLDRGNAATWHRVYTREQPFNNLTNIHGYRVRLGDVSGDARPEVLIFEDTDGSAGTGIYRLFANDGSKVRLAFAKALSQDQGTVTFGPHRLVLRKGIDYYDRGPHCCYRKVRETWLRWNGRRTVVVHQAVHENRRGWPPG
jgi:hypothetical protein